jgi:hypothetical protein
LHVKFYFGFQSDKMLENVVFHRFLGNKTIITLNFNWLNLLCRSVERYLTDKSFLKAR